MPFRRMKLLEELSQNILKACCIKKVKLEAMEVLGKKFAGISKKRHAMLLLTSRLNKKRPETMLQMSPTSMSYHVET
jgi:hypothetical protein